MQLFKQVITNFSNNNGSYRAAALSYTSILSLVPFCAVIFAVLSYFPFLNSIRGPLQDFIFKNFMPATGQVVQSHSSTLLSMLHVCQLWEVYSSYLL